MYETIIYQIQDSTGIITLNRPQHLNALSRKMRDELRDVLSSANDDPSVKVVILTGTARQDGRPCFTAGADLKELVETGYPEFTILDAVEGIVSPKNELDFWLLLDVIKNLQKPTIAAIDGVCTAGGLELAMCFDILLVSQTAQISEMRIRSVGRPGGGGGPAMLCRRLGPAKAKELIFTCNPVDGKEAHRIGFANQVFSPDELMPGALDMASTIATMYPPAIRMAKAAINEAADMGINHDIRYSRLCWAALTGATGDEGARALAEKRKPNFSG